MLNKTRSNVAVFLGCGPSINNLTKEEWDRIQTFDTWSINNWIYHPFFVPDFYHVELKSYDYPFFIEHLNDKRHMYQQKCHFLFPENASVRIDKDRIGLLHLLKDYHTTAYPIKHRNRDLLKQIKKSCVVKNKKEIINTVNADYQFDDAYITKSYDISLTCIIEIMYKMGYKTIILYGVDLYDSRYFWTGGNQIYGRVHHQTNKEHENKNPSLPHNTYIVLGFIIDFYLRHIVPNGRNMYLGNSKSLLYPELPQVNILDL